MFQGYGKFISLGKAIREQQQCSSSNICLIPFKAKAWLDLKERKLNGDQVDSKNISTVNHSQWATPSAQEVLRICWQSAIMRSRTYACRGGDE